MPTLCDAYGVKFRIEPPLPSLETALVGDVDVDVLLHPSSWPLSLEPGPHEALRYASEDSGAGEPNLRIFYDESTGWWRLRFVGGVQFAVDRGGSSVRAHWSTPLGVEDAATYLPGSVLSFVLRVRGLVSLHASAVCVGGAAVVFVGPAGAGKSTLALALARRGHPMLSEDVVALSDREGSIWAEPGFPQVRLWPDSARALGEDSLPRLVPNWDKRYLTLQGSASFRSTPAPIRAAYVIAARVEGGRAMLETATARAAFVELLANTRCGGVSDPRPRALELTLLANLARTVPIRRLTPCSDFTRLAELSNVIESDVQALGTAPDAVATA
jgi:hypothetical protein